MYNYLYILLGTHFHEGKGKWEKEPTQDTRTLITPYTNDPFGENNKMTNLFYKI